MSGGGIEAVYRPQGYTEADQRADMAFLCGVRYGRESERARLIARLAEGDVVEAVANVLPLGYTARDPHADVFESATAALSAVRGVLGGEGS